MKGFQIAIVFVFVSLAQAFADWPLLHGNAQHDGFIDVNLAPPFRLAWAREIKMERLGTAMEPIVAESKVFVATHNGHLYAVKAESGEPIWAQAAGAFLQSPAYAQGRVVLGSVDGSVYAFAASDGKLLWSTPGQRGGFSASPVIADGKVLIGSRAGDFLAISLETGKILWRQPFPAPIRQTATFSAGRVFVTPEDLRVRCLEANSGKLLWTSEALSGQTVRDYYPIAVKVGGRTLVIVRSNPVINMGQRIARDRNLLCGEAKVDDSDWKKIDAYIKSDQSHGTAELWEKEQAAVTKYLQENASARSFFVLDGETGKEAFTAPVLWVAGCQGVGAEPALSQDGRLLVFYRSAYGNWNHGVAPLVTLGLYDLAQNKITPQFHTGGKQPPWNTFWGTADESQNFVVAGNTVLIVHQGTLSGFDLKTSKLFPIRGERDTYGGFRNPPWARNEWHGPGRGGVAVAGNRIYWLTGSRILCIASGEQGKAAELVSIDPSKLLPATPPAPSSAAAADLRQLLQDTARELFSKQWAPLFVDPGLSGRDFSFDTSADLFEAIAWAYPHLDPELQQKAKARLGEEWSSHPPFSAQAWYSLKDGERREWFPTPAEVYARLGGDRQPLPFGGLYAAWFYAERCGEWPTVLKAWPQLKSAFEDFEKSKWRLDPAKGDLYANRYLASLLAVERIAAKASDEPTAARAKAMAEQTTEALIVWWQRAAAGGTLTNFNGASQLDSFIGNGDSISLRLAPHRHKIALFRGLTPGVAALVRAKAPEAIASVWRTFETLYLTWPYQGEERQVHFGENFVDPPDLALGGFGAMAWLKKAPTQELASRVDVPFCHADLYYMTKLAIALEGRY